MLRLTNGQREDVRRVTVNLITVISGTLLAGNLLGREGFRLNLFLAGCILLLIFIVFLLWLGRKDNGGRIV